jgi:mRNA interferase MazF
MSLRKGDIVLVPFPFADLTRLKLRPAIVLCTVADEVTVCFISSQNPLSYLVHQIWGIHG